MLKLDHLGEEVLHSRLPGICELSKTFAHVDPVVAPVPVVPTCHYMMGGIATNIHGQAITRTPTATTRSSTVCSLWAKWPAYPYMAPTVWAVTRCWTWLCSAALPACTWKRR